MTNEREEWQSDKKGKLGGNQAAKSAIKNDDIVLCWYTITSLLHTSYYISNIRWGLLARDSAHRPLKTPLASCKSKRQFVIFSFPRDLYDASIWEVRQATNGTTLLMSNRTLGDNPLTHCPRGWPLVYGGQLGLYRTMAKLGKDVSPS